MKHLIRTLLAFGLSLAVALPMLTVADEAVVTGQWKLAVQTPNGVTNPVLTIRQSEARATGEAGYSGTYVGPRGTFELAKIEVDGATFSFPLTVEMPMGAMALQYKGTVIGDKIEGVVGNPRGEIPFTGERIATP